MKIIARAEGSRLSTRLSSRLWPGMSTRFTTGPYVEQEQMTLNNSATKQYDVRKCDNKATNPGPHTPSCRARERKPHSAAEKSQCLAAGFP
eukprot:4062043-Pyramimonas_sp.AAC.2